MAAVGAAVSIDRSIGMIATQTVAASNRRAVAILVYVSLNSVVVGSEGGDAPSMRASVISPKASSWRASR